MRKTPPTCPKCGTVFQAVSAKAKRKASPPEEKPKPVRKKPADDLELADKVLGTDADDDEEDDEMIEDASELGEDDEDVSEVIETKVDDQGQS
jgi:uncharacterized Zn finger protein (UPF0148 family)